MFDGADRGRATSDGVDERLQREERVVHLAGSRVAKGVGLAEVGAVGEHPRIEVDATFFPIKRVCSSLNFDGETQL